MRNLASMFWGVIFLAACTSVEEQPSFLLVQHHLDGPTGAVVGESFDPVALCHLLVRDVYPDGHFAGQDSITVKLDCPQESWDLNFLVPVDQPGPKRVLGLGIGLAIDSWREGEMRLSCYPLVPMTDVGYRVVLKKEAGWVITESEYTPFNNL